MTIADTEARKAKSKYLLGALFGIAAISIWAGWMSITRLGVTSSLSAYDLTLLRFGTAGLLLLPIAARSSDALRRLGWWRLIVLVSGAGAPYAMVATSGLKYAPAAHAGSLVPGVMPLFVALLSLVVLRERFTRSRALGYGLILTGGAVIAGMSALIGGGETTKGHLLFLAAAFMWACYTLVLRQSRLSALDAAALVSVGSAVTFLPVFVLAGDSRFTLAPWNDILFQAIFQGFFATILSLYFFGKAISILGASSGAAFGALVPAMAALIAIPLLGEFPTASDWAGIALVSSGVFLASGGWHLRVNTR